MAGEVVFTGLPLLETTAVILTACFWIGAPGNKVIRKDVLFCVLLFCVEPCRFMPMYVVIGSPVTVVVKFVVAC